jgi:hypothetical protein
VRRADQAHCPEGEFSLSLRRLFEQEKLTVSSKAAIKPSTLTTNGIDISNDVPEDDELLQVTDAPASGDMAADNTDAVALVCEPSAPSADAASAIQEGENATIAESSADEAIPPPAEIEANDAAGRAGADQLDDVASSVSQSGPTASTELQPIGNADAALTTSVDQTSTLTSEALPPPHADNDPDVSLSALPDPAGISARLRDLVVTVAEVEELSRRARAAAANDLEMYNGIATSQRQFEDGLADSRRIGREAEEVYQRAFGREARAVAEPAVAEAREVEQAFAELADAWRQRAEFFLSEHPDVETLLAEQRQRDDEAHRREIARAKAERFQQLVNATDCALRQGLLDEARDCLKMLGKEYPNEADRLKPLHDRLQHRVRAVNDAAARRVLVDASELQGRGEFNAAVRLLEAVDVHGLSREASEDVFGRWSAACSLLAQTGDLELLRYSPTQGRGIILHRDPSVPYGLVEFSALGMGPSHFEGRVVSAADREGSVIISRARSFRAAELPSEMHAGWYGRSYVVASGSPAAPVRH